MRAVSAMAPALRAAGGAVLDLLLPRACVACERLLGARDRPPVCGTCWVRLRELPRPRCERCGHPLTRHPCGWCAELPPSVRAVRSVCWVPGGSAGEIVHALKYHGWRLTAEGMADRMARVSWPDDVLRERVALVPVPLARARQRERGFNQSELLAQRLSARWHLPVWSALERVRETRSQTRLTPEQRRSNVAGAFRAAAAARVALRRAHVVLVDDVVTTGATLAQCVAALVAAGARIASCVTFGRAPTAADPVESREDR